MARTKQTARSSTGGCAPSNNQIPEFIKKEVKPQVKENEEEKIGAFVLKHCFKLS